MEICTIGFGQKDAATFFGLLNRAGVKQLLDIRLNNMSQLAGFTKRSDLPFFLEKICGAAYQHELLLAPTKEMLDAYRKDGGSWAEYEQRFLALMAERQVETALAPALFERPTVLLCSEPTAEKCHRRLAAEYLQRKWKGVSVSHL